MIRACAQFTHALDGDLGIASRRAKNELCALVQIRGKDCENALRGKCRAVFNDLEVLSNSREQRTNAAAGRA